MNGLRLLLLLLPGIALAETWHWDFESAQLDAWEQVGTGSWNQVKLPARGGVIELTESGDIPTKPVRKPANILLAPAPAVSAFSLDLEVRSLQFERIGADIVIIFGYQDPQHFYYAHISNDVNHVHQVIMKVEGNKNARRAIHLEAEPIAALKDAWQRIRITRSAAGRVEVFVDDMVAPSLTANDATWISGRIGIGSFNDAAQFDSIVLSSE
jgi:hypothetical protein